MIKNSLLLIQIQLICLFLILVSPSTAYEIENFQNSKDLQMRYEGTFQVYFPSNSKKRYSVEIFSAWVVKDSHYNEILLPVSAFKRLKNQFTVCSVGKPLFKGGASRDYSHHILKQCQSLTVRIKDSQYIYAGYITPADRIQ
jgi:hypothetical protein